MIETNVRWTLRTVLYPFLVCLAPVAHGQFAYVANLNSNDISGYTIDHDSGTLTPLGGSPFPTAVRPDSVSIDASGRFMYVSSFAMSNASGYVIDEDSGALIPVARSPFAAGTMAFSVGTTPVLPVRIDINPGEGPALVNPHGRRDIRVAILSSPLFSARKDIDIDSLTFGHKGNERSLSNCDAKEEDVNGDGLPDLICHFEPRESEFRPGDTVGTLEGETKTKVPLLGTDSILVVSEGVER